MLHLYNFKSLTVHVCVNDKVICVVYLSKFPAYFKKKKKKKSLSSWKLNTIPYFENRKKMGSDYPFRLNWQ